MSSTVWKYKLEAKTTQEIEMPWGARILKLAVMGTTPCLWVMVDPSVSQMKSHAIEMHQTGEEIKEPEQLQFIGSIAAENADGKAEVIHCFERLRIIV